MARVIVVGAANADYILRVPHLPRPGETVTGGRLSVGAGGKGANQAHAAARLGADVTLVACIGTDDAGRAERAALAADGIRPDGLAEVSEPTGVAVVLVDEAGENAIAVAPGANDLLTPDLVRQRLAGPLEPGPAGPGPTAPGPVVLCSLEVPLAAAVAAAEAATAAGALCVVNPAPARPLPAALLHATILTPNEGELTRLVTGATGETAALDALLAAGVRAVVVTRGSRGASVYRRDASPSHLPAPAVPVVDTVGAGDAFNGALAWSLACGAALPAAVTAAVAAGAAACTATGARAALPTPAALAALLPPAAFAAAQRPPAR